MSQSSIVPVTPSDADALFDKAIQRSEAGGQGLNARTVALMRGAQLGTGGAMLRAAAGRLGTQLPVRQIINLILLLDGSGSMLGARAAVKAGVNDMIDDLGNERNPQRDSFELTIWIFRDDSAELLEVTDPVTGNRMEVVNIPITQMPHLEDSDYVPSGATPLYKTALAAMGAGSLRSERLRMGMDGKNKATAMNMLVIASDGENTLNQEMINGNTLYYRPGEVEQVSRDLLQTEQWVLAYGYAGSGLAETQAKAVGFPMYADIDKVGGWRKFLGIVSRSAQAVSRAASTGATGSQAAAQSLGGGFFGSLPGNTP